MIRIATLCQTKSLSLPLLQPIQARQPEQPLDILCCQIKAHKSEQAQGYLQDLAASLQMTCSSTMLAGHDKTPAKQEASVLSILTGSRVWVLNSGSIALATDLHEKERVQFALVRKGSVSTLIVHIPHASRRKRLALARVLFSHQIIREQRYSAVILCGQRSLRLTRSEAGQLLAGTNLILHSNLHHEMDAAGAMMLCVAREPGLAGLKLGKQDSCTLAQYGKENPDADVPLFICEFQAQVKAAAPRKKPHYPLSFAEQWAGYKEHFRPSVL